MMKEGVRVNRGEFYSPDYWSPLEETVCQVASWLCYTLIVYTYRSSRDWYSVSQLMTIL